MGKPWKRKKKKRDRAHHGPCFIEGCKHNGSLMHTCKVCEALKNAAMNEPVRSRKQEKWLDKEPFTVKFCGHHVIEADAAIKKHVLTKHPSTIPAWIAHKLLGEA